MKNSEKSIRPRISVPIILLTILLIVPWPMAFPWGSVGHRFINTKAVYHLPSSMLLFIQDSSQFGQHASDADNRKSSDPAESPRHFIDIDDYPDYRNLPHDYDSVVAMYGISRAVGNGTLPWATLWTYDSLVVQLVRGDWTKVVLTASDLGHYVGDGYQPLHVTKNYDGQYTGNNGIHSRYESGMLGSSAYGYALAITPDSTRYISDRPGLVFTYLLRNNGVVDSILHADTFAKATSGWNGSGQVPSAYYTALWGETGGLTLAQMQGATVSLASLWYSAWVDAGLIQTEDVSRQMAAVPTDLHLDQNYPNPFNPSTTISYRLPVGGTVRLAVYSLDGRLVAMLADGLESAGTHSLEFDGRGLASGVYLCRLSLGKFTQVRKLVLLR